MFSGYDGIITEKKMAQSLKIRRWTCPECRIVHDPDGTNPFLSFAGSDDRIRGCNLEGCDVERAVLGLSDDSSVF